jgi:hypothetical protein
VVNQQLSLQIDSPGVESMVKVALEATMGKTGGNSS